MPSPTIVQITGVGNVQFPDSMTPDQVNAAAHNLYTKAGAQQIAANPPSAAKPNVQMQQAGSSGWGPPPPNAEESAPTMGGDNDIDPTAEPSNPALNYVSHAAQGFSKGAAQTGHSIGRILNAATGDNISALPTTLTRRKRFKLEQTTTTRLGTSLTQKI